MSKKVVTFGEIMIRVSPPGFLRFRQARSFDVIYGGGEANVAVSLANYGVPVDFVTRLPNNDLGDACTWMPVLVFSANMASGSKRSCAVVTDWASTSWRWVPYSGAAK